MSFRYIGSKARLAENISQYIGNANSHGKFIDAFCGTGIIAQVAADSGWPILLNDHLCCATIIAQSRLLCREDIPFSDFGGYEAALSFLNQVQPQNGFFWEEYSPASSGFCGFTRRYFTEANAAKIDAIRNEIKLLTEQKRITAVERVILLATLISATNDVANTAGTYGCYMSSWQPQALRSFVLQPLPLRINHVACEVSNLDVFAVDYTQDDLVYLDPPYTKRQYAAYYHILETIACEDHPSVIGKTGLRPWQTRSSVFCYKQKATDALVKLVSAIPSKVLLSYSGEGHVNIDTLICELMNTGRELSLHEIGKIGRYRPNQSASERSSVVAEYLLTIEKA